MEGDNVLIFESLLTFSMMSSSDVKDIAQKAEKKVNVEGKDLNILIKNYLEYRRDYYEKNKELFRKLAEGRRSETKSALHHM